MCLPDSAVIGHCCNSGAYRGTWCACRVGITGGAMCLSDIVVGVLTDFLAIDRQMAG
jgi:hypothetical protein